MTVFVAGLAAFGVFLAVSRRPLTPLDRRVARHVVPVAVAPTAPAETSRRSEQAGYTWSIISARVRGAAAMVAGVLVGLLLAQGDLVPGAAGGSPIGLGMLGGAAGGLAFSMHLSSRQQQRARRLRHELPVVADSLALGILAGESVSGAIRGFVDEAAGVAASELGAVLDAHGAGADLTAALTGAGRRTAHPDARRLYALLGAAHVTGGRLADALAELAVDLRAGIARDITTESGRRAITAHGPILALMVPVTLLFLMFPAIAGLRSLAHG